MTYLPFTASIETTLEIRVASVPVAEIDVSVQLQADEDSADGVHVVSVTVDEIGGERVVTLDYTNDGGLFYALLDQIHEDANWNDLTTRFAEAAREVAVELEAA